MKKVVRLTESDIERIVKRVINEDPMRRDIGSHDDFRKYGRGTKWAPASKRGKEFYDMFVEKFGPFTVYINGDKKVVCQGNRCYNDMDHALSGREEAAEYLGVNSLDDIM